MAAVEDLIASLAARHPDEAEDLQDALEVLKRQKLNTLARLAKLNDSQWQRLGLPLGIEALLREEVEAAEAGEGLQSLVGSQGAAESSHAKQKQSETREDLMRSSTGLPSGQENIQIGSESDDDDVEDELFTEAVSNEKAGLYRRGQGGSRRSAETTPVAEQRRSRKAASSLGRMDELRPPPNLRELWEKLLQDTLTPDKREALEEQWNSTSNESDRYMMFLEYTSYLRKQELTEEEKAERQKQLAPLMRQYGLEHLSDEEESGSFIFWMVLLGIIFFMAGVIYYAHAENADPHADLHDVQSL
eukprot:TRINITY_DN5346_c1_g2_i2.p1 TRINITY_DN5346_c1_g2~~TRINITY_DN5346_c1_g2_i2.p1  ORF type:complete len:303 (-),score=85.29 TRINITY_DN5346_c1_g2_i2:74-982(-)